MRISYDRAANAVYLHLTDQPLTPGSRTTTQAELPPGLDGFVALDWNDGRLIGIEILDATSRLTNEVLEQADQPDQPD